MRSVADIRSFSLSLPACPSESAHVSAHDSASAAGRAVPLRDAPAGDEHASPALPPALTSASPGGLSGGPVRAASLLLAISFPADQPLVRRLLPVGRQRHAAVSIRQLNGEAGDSIQWN